MDDRMNQSPGVGGSLYSSARAAQADYARADVPEPSPLQGHCLELERIGQRISELRDATRSIADAMLGATMEGKQTASSPRPVRSGLVGGFQDRSQDINAMLDSLASEIYRLQQL
jgi:hypothetical protein